MSRAWLFVFNTISYIYSVTEWGITRQGLLNKCPGGWIYSQYGSANKKGGTSTHWCSGAMRALFLLSRCSEWVRAVLQWGQSVIRCCLWERSEGELVLSLMEKCLSCGRACVVYVAAVWWAAAGTDHPVIRTGRCSSLVSRVTLMSFGTLVTIANVIALSHQKV